MERVSERESTKMGIFILCAYEDLLKGRNICLMIKEEGRSLITGKLCSSYAWSLRVASGQTESNSGQTVA